jgi:hypothetical protein
VERVPVSTRRPLLPQLSRARALTVATAGVLVAGLAVAPSVADEGDGSAVASSRSSASGGAKGYRGRTGERVDIFQRDWLHREGGRRKKLRTIWLAEEIGSTDTAVAELKEILGHVFESPKPTGMIRRILQTMPADAVVLDFFAGSGTTGHAVALQNQADGGTRRCISINSAEAVRPGSNADLAGYATVADITRARLTAVDALLGGGFEARRLAPQPPNEGWIDD